MTTNLTRGIHHVGLTVPDLDEARAFFCGLLGFEEVGGVPDYPSIFVSDGLRFGTSRHGLPIGVQIAASWYAESNMFDVASRLEAVSPVRNLRPEL
jgi:catechol 2,3-dioxygenase-like lactoylglutathione lyase family enzyme